MIYFLYFIFGVFGGILGGMGMGGGTLLIPILVLILNMEQTMAQGINLLSFLVMSIISIIIHFKNNFIVFDSIFFVILGGLFSAVVGAILANYIDQNILRKLFGFFLLMLGFFSLIKLFKKS